MKKEKTNAIKLSASTAKNRQQTHERRPVCIDIRLDQIESILTYVPDDDNQPCLLVITMFSGQKISVIEPSEVGDSPILSDLFFIGFAYVDHGTVHCDDIAPGDRSMIWAKSGSL